MMLMMFWFFLVSSSTSPPPPLAVAPPVGAQGLAAELPAGGNRSPALQGGSSPTLRPVSGYTLAESSLSGGGKGRHEHSRTGVKG